MRSLLLLPGGSCGSGEAAATCTAPWRATRLCMILSPGVGHLLVTLVAFSRRRISQPQAAIGRCSRGGEPLRALEQRRHLARHLQILLICTVTRRSFWSPSHQRNSPAGPAIPARAQPEQQLACQDCLLPRASSRTMSNPNTPGREIQKCQEKRTFRRQAWADPGAAAVDAKAASAAGAMSGRRLSGWLRHF